MTRTPTMTSPSSFLDSGRRTLAIEITALQSLGEQLGDSFISACRLLSQCKGKVVVCGVGKSGHIATKIAATLASTGTPAFSLHPTEAAHGDLGMVEHDDLVIAISYSGSSDELITILPALKRKNITVVAITGNPNSPLADAAEVCLQIQVHEEACPHNLAPTASTTATLVIGDMLAIALLEQRGFTKEDFALSHPAGRLGKRLILQISDIMHRTPNIPLVQHSQPLNQCLLVMTSFKLGMIGVVNQQQQLIGMFTDGDLRRVLEQQESWKNQPIERVMTTEFTTIRHDSLAADALAIFEEKKINSAFVTDDNHHVMGAFNMHDLLQSGIV